MAAAVIALCGSSGSGRDDIRLIASVTAAGAFTGSLSFRATVTASGLTETAADALDVRVGLRRRRTAGFGSAAIVEAAVSERALIAGGLRRIAEVAEAGSSDRRRLPRIEPLLVERLVAGSGGHWSDVAAGDGTAMGRS